MSTWPFVAIAVAIGTWVFARKLREPLPLILLPLATAAVFVSMWHLSCEWMSYDLVRPDGTVRRIELFPTPWQVIVEMQKPVRDGTLLRHSVSSVYRVAVGFGIATMIGIPLGLWVGWSLRARQALNPLIQGLRPISPIAWIPIAILGFGVEDASAIFLIALSSFFPIATGTMTAVRGIPLVYVRSAQNFGLRGMELFRRVVFPACLPQIITSLRLALGIAWMVIVAAEMIAVDGGLGYLINDARNANNYERVVGSMVTIGLIGIGLDFLMQRLERGESVRWGFPNLRDAARTERVRTETGRSRPTAG